MVEIMKNNHRYEIKCERCGKHICKDDRLATIDLKKSYTKIRLCESCTKTLLKELKDKC